MLLALIATPAWADDKPLDFSSMPPLPHKPPVPDSYHAGSFDLLGRTPEMPAGAYMGTAVIEDVPRDGVSIRRCVGGETYEGGLRWTFFGADLIAFLAGDAGGGLRYSCRQGSNGFNHPILICGTSRDEDGPYGLEVLTPRLAIDAPVCGAE